MSEYLNSCLKKGDDASDPAADLASFKAIEGGSCLEPSQASTFPYPPRTYDGLPTASLAGSSTTGFASNTAQFQEKVHMDFNSSGIQDMGQGVDMSTYLTQMSMTTESNFANFNTNMNTNTNTGNYPVNNRTGNEAHISPLSYNNPLSSHSGNSSYASSRNFSGSSKTTPESSGLVDPQPNYFDGGKGSGNSNSPMGYMIYGQEEQQQQPGQTRFNQMEKYFDTMPNQDSKMYQG
jgi:hypothetical protein